MIFQTNCIIILLVFIFSTVASEEAPCKDPFKVKLKDVEVKDGSVKQGNVVYANGTFWLEKGIYYGCPCLVKPCIRECTQDLAAKMGLELPERKFKVEIKDDEQSKEVILEDHFALSLNVTACHLPQVLEEEFELLANGSLNITHYGGESTSILEFDTFCILNNSSKLAVVECFEPDEALVKHDTPGISAGTINFINFIVFVAIFTFPILLT